LDLRETPVVTIAPPGEPGANDIEQKLKAVETEAGKAETVAAARRTYDSAAARRTHLERVRDALNRHVAKINGSLKRADGEIEAALIGQYLEGGGVADIGGIVDLMLHNQAERKAALSVIERIVEDRLPAALAAELQLRGDWLWVLAEELSRIAHERFEKTADMLRGATEFESGLCVDIRSTFSGVILARAESLRDESRTVQANGKEIERKHRAMMSQVGPRAAIHN
jgi:hypothetical protein